MKNSFQGPADLPYTCATLPPSGRGKLAPELPPNRLHGWSVLTVDLVDKALHPTNERSHFPPLGDPAAVKRPCLKAFVLPTGAPGDAPPCIRQRPFVIAGDRHGIPLLVLAPHRGLRCMG